MLPTPSSQPRKPGRPHALDDTMRREICALVSAGCGIEGAAKYVGCAASTVRREGVLNPEFGDALRRAQLSAELAPLQLMREFARKYWRAAAWLLERTNPQRFAKQNVRWLKPEQLGEFTQMVGQIIRDEVQDDDAKLRVARRLQKLTKWAEQESWAQNAPIPKTRKRPKGYRPRNN